MIYEKPSSLKGKLFPTMMDDQLFAAKAAMSRENGTWYRCPNGHPYFIGNVSSVFCPTTQMNDYKFLIFNSHLDSNLYSFV